MKEIKPMKEIYQETMKSAFSFVQEVKIHTSGDPIYRLSMPGCIYGTDDSVTVYLMIHKFDNCSLTFQYIELKDMDGYITLIIDSYPFKLNMADSQPIYLNFDKDKTDCIFDVFSRISFGQNGNGQVAVILDNQFAMGSISIYGTKKAYECSTDIFTGWMREEYITVSGLEWLGYTREEIEKLVTTFKTEQRGAIINKEKINKGISDIMRRTLERLKQVDSLEDREYLLFSTIGNFNESYYDKLHSSYDRLMSNHEKMEWFDNIIEEGLSVPIPSYGDLLLKTLKDTKQLETELTSYIEEHYTENQ